MFRHALGILFACTVLALSVPQAQAQTVSSFDAGLEGWTATGGALSFVSTGGNPGGFLRLDDNQGDYMTVYASAKFLGDQSAYQGGTLTFDAKNLNGAAPTGDLIPLFGTITITGPEGTASTVLGGTGQPPADNIWHRYSISMTSALWSGNLVGALSNVTSVSMILESNDAIVESNGFDNFRIAPGSILSAPEPSTYTLLGSLGLTGAAFLCRRRASK